MPHENTVVANGRCVDCGADPQSPLALTIEAEVQKRTLTGPRVICPNCGSTQGFGPVPQDFTQDQTYKPFGLLYLLVWIVGATANMGELECSRCQHVFRTRSRIREIGCIALLGLIAAVVMALLWLSGSPARP
jgi:hypothetical protein